MGERVTCPRCGRAGVTITSTGKMRLHYVPMPNGVIRGPECTASGRRPHAPRRKPAPRPTIRTMGGETGETECAAPNQQACVVARFVLRWRYTTQDFHCRDLCTAPTPEVKL